MDGARLTGGRAGKGQQPKSLFGGLLRCGVCGGAMIAVDARRYGCAARKDRGRAVCTGVSAPREAVDMGLLSMARDELLAPAMIAEVGRQVEALLRERRQGLSDARKTATARAKALEAEIQRLTDAIAQMGLSTALRARLEVAERERAELAAQPTPLATGDASWRARYKAQVMRLRAALESDTATAREALRDVFGEVRLVAEGGAVFAEIQATPAIAIAGAGALLGMVAGARYATRKRLT
jgi:site-specific DNA recombinase